MMPDTNGLRRRYLVITRDERGLEGIGVETMNEALRIIADDDYGLGPDGYEAIYDSEGRTHLSDISPVLCGPALAYEVAQYMAGRRADEEHERSLGRVG